jgi:hypothetical protein
VRRLPPRESDKGVGTGNTGGMRGTKRKEIYSSPFEAEWAVLNHKRIFYDSDIHSGVFKGPP